MGRPAKDIAGNRYGRLVVQFRVENNKYNEGKRIMPYQCAECDKDIERVVNKDGVDVSCFCSEECRIFNYFHPHKDTTDVPHKHVVGSINFNKTPSEWWENVTAPGYHRMYQSFNPIPDQKDKFDYVVVFDVPIKPLKACKRISAAWHIENISFEDFFTAMSYIQHEFPNKELDISFYTSFDGNTHTNILRVGFRGNNTPQVEDEVWTMVCQGCGKDLFPKDRILGTKCGRTVCEPCFREIEKIEPDTPIVAPLGSPYV